MIKSAEELVTFGQGNLDAMMKSTQVLVTGFQDMAKQAAASTQASIEETVAALRALTQVRSVKEAVELQSSLARTSLDKAMSQGGQVAEASYKLIEQASAPIAQRMSLAAETFARV